MHITQWPSVAYPTPAFVASPCLALCCISRTPCSKFLAACSRPPTIIFAVAAAAVLALCSRHCHLFCCTLTTLYNILYATATDVPGVMTATGMDCMLTPLCKIGGLDWISNHHWLYWYDAKEPWVHYAIASSFDLWSSGLYLAVFSDFQGAVMSLPQSWRQRYENMVEVICLLAKVNVGISHADIRAAEIPEYKLFVALSQADTEAY
jgi:hypothetical protein